MSHLGSYDVSNVVKHNDGDDDGIGDDADGGGGVVMMMMINNDDNDNCNGNSELHLLLCRPPGNSKVLLAGIFPSSDPAVSHSCSNTCKTTYIDSHWC